MKKRIAVLALIAAGLSGNAIAQTTGFDEGGVGPFDYDDTANWVGGTVNGIWDSSLTLTGAQVVNFDSDLVLSTGLTLNYSGNQILAFRGGGTNRTITLGGNISVNPASNQTVNIGSSTGGQNVNVNLNGVSRTMSVGASKTLNLVNVVSNGSIIKDGGGTLILTGANTFAGGLTLDAGSLSLANNAALGTGTLTINGGSISASTTRATTNLQNWNGDFSFGGSNTWNTGTGSVTMNASRVITVTGSTMTVGGAIDDSGSNFGLTKTGAGALTLTAVNTYSGGTVVNQGTLNVGASGTLGDNVAFNTVTVSGGGVLNLAAATNIGSNQSLSLSSTSTDLTVLGLGYNGVQAFSVTGDAPVVIGVNTTGYTAISSQAAVGSGKDFLGSSTTGTFSGSTLGAGSDGVYRLGGGGGTLTVTDAVVSGGGSLVVGSALTNGGGTVVLQGSNSLSGTTTVNGGTLRLSGATGSLANSDITVTTLSSGVALNFENPAGTTGTTRAKSVTLAGNGALTLTGAGTSSTNWVDTITGKLTVIGSKRSTSLGSDALPNVTISPGSAGRNGQLIADSIERQNNGVVLFRGTGLGSSAISSPSANTTNISFSGSAPALIGGGGSAGDDNISIIPWAIGGTSVSDGGSTFVTYTATNGIRPLDTASEFATTIGVNATDNVRLVGATVLNGAATVNSLINTSGALSGTDSLTVTSGAIFLFQNGSVSKSINFGTAEGVIGYARGNSMTGGIAGSGGLTVYGLRTNEVLALRFGTYTYTGKTTVLGALEIGSSTLPSGARTGDVYLYGGLRLDQGGYTGTINGLFGTGVLSYGNSGASTISIGDNNATSTFDGTITNSNNNLDVIKVGSGTLTLTGANDYDQTIIRGGVLSTPTLADGGTASGIGDASSAADKLILNGGTLRYTGAATETDRLFQVGETGDAQTGTIDASGTGAVNFDNSGAITYGTAGTTATSRTRTLVLTGSNTGANTLSAAIGNNGSATNGNSAVSVTKSGVGKWVLSGTNTYTGGTTVGGGTMLVTGTINNTSAVTINAGTFDYANNSTALNRAVTVAGGTFKYNSTQQYTGALTFTSGKIGGTGNLSGTALTIGAGQIMSPGNSTGTLPAGATTWADDGTFEFELNDATGIAGSTTAGWDLLNAATLSITAGVAEFNIQIFSLDSAQAAGLASNFDELSSYSWLFVDAGSAITTFNANQFLINTAAFQNAFTGTFGIARGDTIIGGDDTQLYLTYTPVPEPSVFALLGLSLSALCFRRRRRA